MDFFELIDKSIRGFEGEIHEDELAYLAMTSKVERPFQDKLAYILHKNMKKNEGEFYVAREWRRSDIAILDKKDKPHCLIECKATNTQHEYKGIDSGKINHIEKHLKEVIHDLDDLETPRESSFGILVGTHPTAKIPQNPAIKKIYKPPPCDPKEIERYYKDTIKKFCNDKSICIKEEYCIDVKKYEQVPIKLIVHLLLKSA